jgi:N-acetylglutamate synthase-like GNAT family acetyltransferase
MDFRSIAIKARHDLTPDELGRLEDRLYEINARRTGYEDAALLGFVAEAEGELVAAAAGYTWGGICELRQVWVQEAHRGKGLGEALITEASREAKARGCAYVYLATHDFQAPGFYAKLGFEKVAEIPDKPLGHTEFVMRLRLRSDARGNEAV